MAKATKQAPAPEVEAPEAATKRTPEENAKHLFAKFPHVHTIWFDDKGEWRFYHTPGSKAIERGDV